MNYVIDIFAYLLTIFCTIAQGFCITSTATGDNWYGAVEESLWGISHACLAPCIFYLFTKYCFLDCKKIQTDAVNLKDT